MDLEEFVWWCASSVSPSATWAFLFNFTCPVGQCDQGSSRKMWESSRALEIFLFTFLDWPDFHLAEYLFLLWMPFKKLWDMYSSYLFTPLTTMQKDSDRQFQERQNASRINMVILLSIRMLCWIRWCCEKNMKTVSLSSTSKVALECVCFRFLLATWKASDSTCGQNHYP